MKLINITFEKEIPEIMKFLLDKHGYSVIQCPKEIRNTNKSLLINYKDHKLVKECGGINIHVGSEEREGEVWINNSGDIRLVLMDFDLFMTLRRLS